jgi:4a-hydroxytetrahydrobiopterin dehydratase
MEKPHILSQEKIQEELKKLEGWTYNDNKISKEFKFNDFMDSLNFINVLAPFCEQLDHHPDVHIFYSKVLFELQRFDLGGKVTDKDFMVAGEIERLYKEK